MSPLHALLGFLDLAERPMRNLADAVNDELGRQGVTDLNDHRALMLLQIGEGEISPGMLIGRWGNGSNATYNIKKLVAAGYVNHARAAGDRRLVLLSLTAKGLDMRDRIFGRVADLADALGDQADDTAADLAVTRRTLKAVSRRLEVAREERVRRRNR